MSNVNNNSVLFKESRLVVFKHSSSELIHHSAHRQIQSKPRPSPTYTYRSPLKSHITFEELLIYVFHEELSQNSALIVRGLIVSYMSLYS